ncbi:MAG TPA: DinB family protein [Gemmatimonadales bacterium]|nr:DinB family protein [Gemmatimonadales bacterium]
MNESELRAQLARALGWDEAHAGFDRVVEGIGPEFRGRAPGGLPYSPWQLLEHMRLAQEDILEFCRNPDYTERRWPDDYWPGAAEPPDAGAWEGSIAALRRDREALAGLARDPSNDLTAPLPHGSGQTLLRELLLVLDHTAYHLGELVVVRRALGIWR